VEHASVLASTQVRRAARSTGEQVVVGFQAGLPDPRLHRFAGSRRDLELDRPLRLLLQDGRPAGDPVTEADIADAQLHQIAGA
jgi:hypothetical protein